MKKRIKNKNEPQKSEDILSLPSFCFLIIGIMLAVYLKGWVEPFINNYFKEKESISFGFEILLTWFFTHSAVILSKIY